MTPGESPTADLLFATDLDACLLDEATYAFDAARPALTALAERRIPLVLASSKTRAEMQPLARALGLGTPLIVENGGALLVPEGHLARRPQGASLVKGSWTLVLGARREELLPVLAAIAQETGASVRSFASLGAGGVERLTGLTPAAAALALEREYDEPFLLEDDGCAEIVAKASRARGLRVTRGGRFWHLTGNTDKGRALMVLLGLHAAEGRRFSTVGLGDAANDLALLKAVERPVVVPRPGGTLDPVLQSALPHAERAPGPGPAGWNEAVLAILRGYLLPHVASASA